MDACGSFTALEPEITLSRDIRDWLVQVSDYATVPFHVDHGNHWRSGLDTAVFRIVFGPGPGYPTLHVAFDADGVWVAAWVEGAGIPAATRSPGEPVSAVAAIMVTALTTSARPGSWAAWVVKNTPSSRVPVWARRAVQQEKDRAERARQMDEHAAKFERERARQQRTERARAKALEALAEAHPDEYEDLFEQHLIMEALK